MAMIRSMRMAIAGIAALAAPAFAQDAGADAGQLVFNNACRTCHSVQEGDNRLGPSLAGVVGRKAGSSPGFGYSDALKASGITWDDATLDHFIANPDEVVPGNRMKPYGGIADADERAKIVAYLKAPGG